MAFRAHIADTAAAARHRNMVPFAALVFAAAALVALFSIRWVTSLVQLPFHGDSGIVGWVTVHRYAKSQEIFNLAVTVIGLPATLLAAWWAWITGATWGARWARCAPSRLLRQQALAGMGTFALTPTLARLEVKSLQPLMLSLSGVALACLVVVLFNRFLGARHDKSGPANEGAREPAPAIPALSAISLRILRRTLVWVVLPATIYGLTFENRIDNGIDHFSHFHEGERLYPAWAMRHGLVPYRDVYMQHGFFRNALVSRTSAALFGPTLEGQRRFEDIMWPLGKVSVYVAGATLLDAHPVSSLVLALLLLSSRVEFPDRFLFAALALAVMAAVYRRSHPLDLLRLPYPPDSRTTRLQHLTRFARHGWPLLLSGALASLAFWTSVETGLFAWAGMLAFLAAVALLGPGGRMQARLGPLLAFALGAFVGFWMVGWYFAWHGAVADVIRNVYQQCAYQTETWGLPFPKLLDIQAVREGGRIVWGQSLQTEAVVMYLPFAFLLVAELGLVWLWVRGRLWTSPRGWRLLLLTCVGLFFARGLLGRSDSWHMYNGMISQVLIFALALSVPVESLCHQLGALRAGVRRFPLRSLLALLCAIPLLALAGPIFEPLQSLKGRFPAAWANLKAVRSWRPDREPFPGAGRISMTDGDADRLRRMVGFIHDNTRPGEAVINFSDYATLMAFADRPSASRYFMPCYMSTRAMQLDAITEIMRRQPRLAYRGIEHDCFDGPALDERIRLVHQYLKDHYEPLGRVDDIEFLWRKGEKDRPALKDLQLAAETESEYQLESASADECLTFAGDPAADGRELQLRTCSHSESQRFRFDPLPDGTYKIRLAGSKKCVDVEAWSHKDGAAVKGFTCHGGGNQAWQILGVGTETVRLVAQHSGKVLDTRRGATAEASPVKQMHWEGGNSQQFRLKVLGPAKEKG